MRWEDGGEMVCMYMGPGLGVTHILVHSVCNLLCSSVMLITVHGTNSQSNLCIVQTIQYAVTLREVKFE